MDPIGFLLGVATFGLAVKFRQPLRKAAVVAAGQILLLAEELKSSAYGLKEEVEDIVAEAHYENMKSKSAGTAVGTGESEENRLH